MSDHSCLIFDRNRCRLEHGSKGGAPFLDMPVDAGRVTDQPCALQASSMRGRQVTTCPRQRIPQILSQGQQLLCWTSLRKEQKSADLRRTSGGLCEIRARRTAGPAPAAASTAEKTCDASSASVLVEYCSGLSHSERRDLRADSGQALENVRRNLSMQPAWISPVGGMPEAHMNLDSPLRCACLAWSRD